MTDKKLLDYVQLTGPLPNVVDSKVGHRLLIIGSAMGVWDDLKRYDYQGHDTMAVNDMMMHFPGRLDYGATLHPDKLPGWAFFQKYEAAKKNWPSAMEVHSHIKMDLVDYYWPLRREGGTGGLFGVTIGLLMGYDRIVVAGVPCDDSPRYFDPPDCRHEKFGRDSVFKEWQSAVNIMQGKVKSLSGRTRELLGEP